MKTMQIFEPAMCCATGLCGVGVDPELLRISTVLNSLEKNGMKVERYNLTNAPMEFIKNNQVNEQLKAQGVDILPLTVLNGEIVITGRYPTNDEFVEYLNVPASFIREQPKVAKASIKKATGGCGCSDGSCC